MNLSRLALPLLIALTACSLLPPPVTPTQTSCAWIRNPGPAPAAVEQAAQQAFTASGIPGSLTLQADGEYYCDQFNAESIYFDFTLTVTDLQDSVTARALVSQAEQIASSSLEGSNLGGFNIRFQTATEECVWNEEFGTCGPVTPRPSPD